MKRTALLLFPILFFAVLPALAVREGSATASVFIKRYARSGDFGRLALWHETAAACLLRISLPMNRIASAYYERHGYEKWVVRAGKEADEIRAHYRTHRTAAARAWHRADTPAPLLRAERERIVQFMRVWMPRYPERFYTFGIYPTFFRKQRAAALAAGDIAGALQLEADAAEMCAAQYEKIPIAYGLADYEKQREAFHRLARYFRDLAEGRDFSQQSRKRVPRYIDDLKNRMEPLGEDATPDAQRAETVLQVAKADERVASAIAEKNGVHAHPTFHGFAWIVRFANQRDGNIATAIVDAETLAVLDVF